jgi:hypothetical protein
MREEDVRNVGRARAAHFVESELVTHAEVAACTPVTCAACHA